MEPDQAQWEDGAGESSFTPNITCRDNGSFMIESGEFTYEGTDPNEAAQQIINLLKHGLERAKGES